HPYTDNRCNAWSEPATTCRPHYAASSKRGDIASPPVEARVDSATILPATVTRTLPSAGEIVMGWSGPGILISLPLLVVVSIALLTVLVTASTRHRREYWHR